MRIRVFALVLLAAAPAAATGPGASRTLSFAGRTRVYRVHRPAGLAKDATPPVVLALHGGGGSAKGMEEQYGLDAWGDRAGMIVAYPEGIGSAIGNFHTWNAGKCCGAAKRKNVDDVGFLKAVIDAVLRDEHADPKRVFVTGHSNGAQMSYRLTCAAPEKLAGIAPVSGQAFSGRCAQGPLVPVLHVHGTADRCVPFEGGTRCGGCFGRALGLGSSETWPCDPVRGSLARRAKAYGCSETARESKREGPVVCEDWTGCPSRGSVTLCRIEGGGHTWQGSAPPAMCARNPDGRLCRSWLKEVGPALKDVDTDALIFDFFRRQSD